jgi:hypothetical protein
MAPFSEQPDSSPVMRLPRCGHSFCQACIEGWFEKGRNSCPNCKTGYPSLRRAEITGALELVQEEDAKARRPNFKVGDDVLARWDDGRAYPATIVSIGKDAVTVSWKDESDADRRVSMDDVSMDSPDSSGTDSGEDENTEIEIKDESGRLCRATVREMRNGLFSIRYTDPKQPKFNEKLTSSELERRSTDWKSCMVCLGHHSSNDMLLCDGCDGGCHLECSDPSLSVVPAGKWFCNKALCRRKTDGRRSMSSSESPADALIDIQPEKQEHEQQQNDEGDEGDNGEEDGQVNEASRNQQRVKQQQRKSYQLVASDGRVHITHTGSGDSYHVHHLGWNRKHDELWTKKMCGERAKDWVDDAEETCHVCGDIGLLIFCDGCEDSFHLGCLSPPLQQVPDEDWYCSSSSCQLKPTIQKYCAQFGSLSSLRDEADSRMVYSGGTIAQLRERLARCDLNLPPSSVLDAAHASFPLNAHVEVEFDEEGGRVWACGTVIRHTEKSVRVHFEVDDSEFSVQLLEEKSERPSAILRHCQNPRLRAQENEVVVREVLSLLIDQAEDIYRAKPPIELLTDALHCLMGHLKAPDFNVPASSLLADDEIANYLSVVPQPMDLGTVKEMLASGRYKTAEDCAVDVLRCFANCRTYHLAHTAISKAADTLQRRFKRLLHDAGLADAFDAAERKITLSSKRRTQKPPPRKPQAKQVQSQLAVKVTNSPAERRLAKDRKAKPTKHENFSAQNTRATPPVQAQVQKRQLSSTSIRVRGSQLSEAAADGDDTTALTRMPSGRLFKMVEITESKDQASAIGMALYQVRCKSTGQAGAVKVKSCRPGEDIVFSVHFFFMPRGSFHQDRLGTDIDKTSRKGPFAGSIAYNAGARVGMELLRFQAPALTLSLGGLGEVWQEFNQIIGLMKSSDRPWTFTFYTAGAVDDLSSDAAFATTAVLEPAHFLGQRLTPPEQPERTSSTLFKVEAVAEKKSQIPEVRVVPAQCNKDAGPVDLYKAGVQVAAACNPASEHGGSDVKAALEPNAAALAQREGQELRIHHELQLQQNRHVRRLETFARLQSSSDQSNQPAACTEIDERSLQSIVRSLIETGARVRYSPTEGGGSSSSSGGGGGGGGIAVFLKHAVLKYVLFFLPNVAAYQHYLTGDRTLDSISGSIENGQIADATNDNVAVLHAAEVITRLSDRVQSLNASTAQQAAPDHQGSDQHLHLQQAVQGLIAAGAPVLLAETETGQRSSQLGVFAKHSLGDESCFVLYLPPDDQSYECYLQEESTLSFSTDGLQNCGSARKFMRERDAVILTAEDVVSRISRPCMQNFGAVAQSTHSAAYKMHSFVQNEMAQALVRCPCDCYSCNRLPAP